MTYDHHFSTIRLQIEYVPPASLKPDKRNPRVHNARQLKALGKSIDAFGFVAPVIADAANVIIAGEARVEAAKRIGLAEIPVVRVEHLDENQKLALMMADNSGGNGGVRFVLGPGTPDVRQRYFEALKTAGVPLSAKKEITNRFTRLASQSVPDGIDELADTSDQIDQAVDRIVDKVVAYAAERIPSFDRALAMLRA